MLTVLGCIVNEHDLRLVGLAAIICSTASFAAITLLHHVRKSSGHTRKAWLAVAAVSTGFGIWATHFIAMLAFSPGIPNAYNIALTGLSLVAAIFLTGVGLSVSVSYSARENAWLGGAMVGGGIAAMHYIGMAAFEIQGRIVWDSTLVAVSIALGGIIGAIALPVGLRGESLKWKISGALLLTVAICSHHFTAMGAVSIIPDPSVALSETALPSGLLAIAVALASFIILVLAFAGVALELRDQRRTALEGDRMRGLANAAIEGLVVCDGDRIVTVNDSFAALAGGTADDMVGVAIAECIPSDESREKLWNHPNQAFEGEILRRDGTKTPVELIQRSVDFAGRLHRAIAVRDLQARKQAENHIHFLAHHDSLTGLPNRSTFNARLDSDIAQARVKGGRLAVFCLDLDRFKEVNDLFGHASGDRVLQTVAKRISGMLGENQMFARLSGDEFAIVVPDLSGPAMAGRIAENVIEALATAASEFQTDTTIAASIGIAIFPDDATDRHVLLSHADTALYRAKNEGRGIYRFFEASMGAAVRDRRLLEHDLRNALANGELRLVYQPQKDIRSGKVIGLEALLRWKHPTRGDVSPADFVPIAEDTGVILQIGEWVLRTACREAATWSEPLTIAVNVSAIQIHNLNFAHAVHEILFETGLTPGRLELKITETALVRDLHRALATLRRIKMLGVRIAMDDFGTGYSSLSNLRAFPFDKIKIDGSFIRSVNTNDQAAAIVRSVLGLGKALKLPVLAEGVETNAELEFLASENCTEVQGYLLGRPASIETLRLVTHGADSTDEQPNPVVLPKASSM
ncbi:MAG: bifunctional diguanylate cyclase/phosphodiesterase [Xanthobacteraceae bacterium]